MMLWEAILIAITTLPWERKIPLGPHPSDDMNTQKGCGSFQFGALVVTHCQLIPVVYNCVNNANNLDKRENMKVVRFIHTSGFAIRIQ